MRKDKLFVDKARTNGSHKSRDRVKKTGEIFSPPALINEMLDQLPEHLWTSGYTVLEPAARRWELRHRDSEEKTKGGMFANPGYRRCLCCGAYER